MVLGRNPVLVFLRVIVYCVHIWRSPSWPRARTVDCLRAMMCLSFASWDFYIFGGGTSDSTIYVQALITLSKVIHRPRNGSAALLPSRDRPFGTYLSLIITRMLGFLKLEMIFFRHRNFFLRKLGFLRCYYFYGDWAASDVVVCVGESIGCAM